MTEISLAWLLSKVAAPVVGVTRQVLGRSLHDTDVWPEYGQQILTLPTCYHAVEGGRLLVIAVKRE